jgi:hypothetical protein
MPLKGEDKAAAIFQGLFKGRSLMASHGARAWVLATQTEIRMPNDGLGRMLRCCSFRWAAAWMFAQGETLARWGISVGSTRFPARVTEPVAGRQ